MLQNTELFITRRDIQGGPVLDLCSHTSHILTNSWERPRSACFEKCGRVMGRHAGRDPSITSHAHCCCYAQHGYQQLFWGASVKAKQIFGTRYTCKQMDKSATAWRSRQSSVTLTCLLNRLILVSFFFFF